MTASPDITRWLEALHTRHVAPYRPQEFTRALRALSARYVERRSELAERSALDSAGKRSAFAAFYAPIHYLTVREIVNALPDRARQVSQITDLGCGTGVCAAAWQHAVPRAVGIVGVDMSQWALEEAKWNWRALGVGGKAKRGDLVAEVPVVRVRPGAAPPTPAVRPNPPALLLAWAVNELPREAREALLPALLGFDGQVLIIEPLARGAAPWWREWATAFAGVGGRADEWKFAVDLPPMISELSSRAGFHREYLGARSLWKD
ncbi:MAG: class I SAM-dependent methyltransferase [Acidobacteria bacterium]|nr:class I SAM-dependent methyltransferase [Acidobacteriota bacterium]MBP8273397.1 class I SAM-dependent methyltransferase [Acidobacteriota bacterium]